MNENTLYHIGIIFINGRSSVYQVTGTELDWLYENMREQKGYWNFSDDAGEDHLINLNNVIEIISFEWKMNRQEIQGEENHEVS